MTDKNKQAAQLKSVVKKADKELLGVVREHEHPATSVFHVGAFDISPRHLAFWVVFETDAERDRFLADKAAPDAMRSTLAELGYPKAMSGTRSSRPSSTKP